MNPDLQKQLAELLAKLMAATEQGAEWAAGQIPPLVAEKILFGRVWETSLLLLLLLALLLASRVGFPFLIKGSRDWQGDGEEFAWVGLFVLSAASVAAVISAIHAFKAALLVWFAPRLYVVEWLKGLVQ